MAALVWFRSNLRVLDNECLLKAYQNHKNVIPVYCFDSRQFNVTSFGFHKTGAHRLRFLLDSVRDLQSSLEKRGSRLLIRTGKPEEVLPQLAQTLKASAVYCPEEICDEEKTVERNLKRALGSKIDLVTVWGAATLVHKEDLPFEISVLPETFTQFRKSVERRENWRIRPFIPAPKTIPTDISALDSSSGEPAHAPKDTQELNAGVGRMPNFEDFGLEAPVSDPRAVLPFHGGETAGLARVQYYLWDSDLLQKYKETRNGMVGGDYSSKLSPYLAHGCISGRWVYSQIKAYEQERVKNNSTYWLVFEFLWRDFLKFLGLKVGNRLFYRNGMKTRKFEWSQDPQLFQAWCEGKTGYPLIDGNMRELLHTGFMSNRGRQIVCSFLTKDMKVDWRMGAEWFESLLIDHDPCANYGNWQYGSGVGVDPREDRYFSIPKQQKTYDPKKEYAKLWIPEMSQPGGGGYPKPVCQLKFSGWSADGNGSGGGYGGGGKKNQGQWKDQKGNSRKQMSREKKSRQY